MSETGLIEWTDHETCSFGTREKTKYHVVPSDSGYGFLCFTMTAIGRRDISEKYGSDCPKTIEDGKRICEEHAANDEPEKWGSPGLFAPLRKAHHGGKVYVYDCGRYQWVRENVLQWQGTDDCVVAKHPSGVGTFVVCREAITNYGKCWLATGGHGKESLFCESTGMVDSLKERCEEHAREWVDSII